MARVDGNDSPRLNLSTRLCAGASRYTGDAIALASRGRTRLGAKATARADAPGP